MQFSVYCTNFFSFLPLFKQPTKRQVPIDTRPLDSREKTLISLLFCGTTCEFSYALSLSYLYRGRGLCMAYGSLKSAVGKVSKHNLSCHYRLLRLVYCNWKLLNFLNLAYCIYLARVYTGDFFFFELHKKINSSFLNNTEAYEKAIHAYRFVRSLMYVSSYFDETKLLLLSFYARPVRFINKSKYQEINWIDWINLCQLQYATPTLDTHLSVYINIIFSPPGITLRLGSTAIVPKIKGDREWTCTVFMYPVC